MLVLGSGLWMIGRAPTQAVQTGGVFSMPLDWTIMATLGLVMIAIFGHIRFALFPAPAACRSTRLAPAAPRPWAASAARVGVNLALGVVIVVVTLLV